MDLPQHDVALAVKVGKKRNQRLALASHRSLHLWGFCAAQLGRRTGAKPGCNWQLLLRIACKRGGRLFRLRVIRNKPPPLWP